MSSPSIAVALGWPNGTPNCGSSSPRAAGSGQPLTGARFVAGSVRHAVRMRRRVLRLDGIGLDLRQARRGLVRSPLFSIGAVTSVALGTAIATAVFTVVDHVVFRPLPVDEGDRIVRVWGRNTESGEGRLGVSWADFVDLNDAGRAFRELAAYRAWDANLHDAGGPPILVPHGYVGERFFDLFRVRPEIGRLFQATDHRPGAEPTVVLSRRLWVSRYGSDPAIVGRSIFVDSRPSIVIGVAAEFDLPDGARIWTPMPTTLVTEPDGEAATGFGRGWRNLSLAGRLRPGSDLAFAQTDLRVVAARLSAAYPATNTAYDLSAEPFLDGLLGSWRRTLTMVLWVAVLVMGIVCTNLANLLLARAAAKSGDSAIRRALGAGGVGAARVFLFETVTLTVTGGLGGLALGHLFLRKGLDLLPVTIPRIDSVGVDVRVALMAMGAVVVVGMLAALPAVAMGARRSVGEGLIGAGRGLRARATPAVFVVTQLGVSVALVTAATLLGITLWNATRVSPGFDARETLSLRLSIRATRAPPWPEFADFFAGLRRDLATISGVETVVVSLGRPVGPEDRFEVGVEIPGVVENPRERRPTAHFRAVSPGYFDLLGIPVEGRRFTERDASDGPGVAIVNRAFVDRYFGGRAPYGHTIERPTFWAAPYPPVAEIVGIAGDVRADGPAVAAAPAMYFPFAQNPFGNAYVLLGGRDAAELLPAVRETIWALDPTLPVQSVETLDEVISRQLAPARFGAASAGVLAGFALLLAAVGLFGIVRYRLERRRQEFGVRMVVGADTSDLLAMVVRDAGRLVAAGLLVGIPMALAAGRMLESRLLGVSPFSLPVLVVTGIVLSGVALGAVWVPAVRAARADPIRLLRVG